MEKKSGSRIWNKHTGSYFKSLLTIFGLLILKFFVVDPDPGSGAFLKLDPGSEMEKFGSGV
jgi:hypothetical protein